MKASSMSVEGVFWTHILVRCLLYVPIYTRQTRMGVCRPDEPTHLYRKLVSRRRVYCYSTNMRDLFLRRNNGHDLTRNNYPIPFIWKHHLCQLKAYFGHIT